MALDRPGTPALLDRAALPALLVLALVLRVREALRVPLWFDELYTRAATGQPWPEVMRVERADVHPPLHFLVAHLWGGLGDADLVLRSSSILFGLLAIVAGYALARELFGRGTALFATLLVVIHPWHIYTSQEFRSYSLLWLALTAAWWGAWRWSERGRRADAALFLAGAAVALWTHYLAGALLAVQAAWGVARFVREPKRLGQWLLLHVALAALFAPALPLLLTQFRRIEGQHWLMPPGRTELFEAARHVAFNSRNALVFLVLLTPWAFAEAGRRRAASFLAVVGPLAVLVCWIAGTRGIRLFAFKYMLFAVAPVLTLAAAGALRLPGRVTRVLAGALLVAFATYALVRQPPYPEAASFAAVRPVLAAGVRPGDTVFHADAHTWLFGRRYFPALRHRLLAMGQVLPYFDGRAVVPDSAFADAVELRDARASGRRWWALAWGRGALDARAFGALADSCAAEPPKWCGLVRVWRGAAIAPPATR